MVRNFEQKKPLANRRILLVEDELDIAELLTFILRGAGAEVRVTTYADEALKALEQFQPDLLICNIRLPDHDGEWVIRHIRANESKQLPAIAVTSYSRDISDSRMLEAGFQTFLHKPLDPDELVAEALHLTN
jgi:CheY-like chemotaxis protein